MYLVDTVVVDEDAVAGYVSLLETSAVPLYRAAGATLEYCRVTDAGLGEPVEVQLAWSFADNTAWNEIRRTLILDPAYYQCAAALAERRRGGTRRFMRAVPEASSPPGA